MTELETDSPRGGFLRGSPDPWAHQLEQRRKHMITIAAGVQAAPVALVQFHKKGIFLHFPFHPESPGLVTRMTVQPGSTDADLALEGAVTSHRVKYSHHLDGRCHFSQDGKIRTVVRNQGRPLDNTVRHLFTIDVQGLHRFATDYETWKGHQRKYGDAYFEFQTEEFPECAHIVGRWLRVHQPERLDELRNPVTILGESERQAAACGPDRRSSLYGGLLILEVRPRDPLTTDKEFQLFCIAGFDEQMEDETKPGSALVLIYPHADDGTLPSIDWNAGAET